MKKKKKKDKTALNEYAFDTIEAIMNFPKLDYRKQIQVVKQGISKRQLEQFRQVADLRYKSLARLIGVTERTLHYTKGDDLFSHAVSDLIASVIDFYGFGYAAFNDPVTFNKWVKVGSPERKYDPPLNHCRTIMGMQEMKRDIMRIKHEHPAAFK